MIWLLCKPSLRCMLNVFDIVKMMSLKMFLHIRKQMVVGSSEISGIGGMFNQLVTLGIQYGSRRLVLVRGCLVLQEENAFC